MPPSTNTSIAVRLWHKMQVAALGSIETSGMPHVSLVTPAPQNDGTALLLLSDLARHTANINREKRISLLVMESSNQANKSELSAATDPLAEERMTVHGKIAVLSAGQFEEGKQAFLMRHPGASQYIDFKDFRLYSFQPVEIFLVGGFGRIETLSANILRL